MTKEDTCKWRFTWQVCVKIPKRSTALVIDANLHHEGQQYNMLKVNSVRCRRLDVQNLFPHHLHSQYQCQQDHYTFSPTRFLWSVLAWFHLVGACCFSSILTQRTCRAETKLNLTADWIKKTTLWPVNQVLTTHLHWQAFIIFCFLLCGSECNKLAGSKLR